MNFPQHIRKQTYHIFLMCVRVAELGWQRRAHVLYKQARVCCIIMRQGRGSEATEAVFCLEAKKTLHSGPYEHRVPKIKNKTFFCTRDVYLCDSTS